MSMFRPSSIKSKLYFLLAVCALVFACILGVLSLLPLRYGYLVEVHLTLRQFPIEFGSTYPGTLAFSIVFGKCAFNDIGPDVTYGIGLVFGFGFTTGIAPGPGEICIYASYWIWSLLMTSGALLCYLMHIKVRPKRHAHLCHSCGYDLRAHHPGQKCPECGTEIPRGSKGLRIE
jgi:predicted RNA-binding Zn-ribbon protein involved in translation (DUF1610 family)